MTYHSETQERSACRKLTKITKSLGLSSNVLFRYHICSFKHDIYRCSTVALDSNDRDATLLVSPLSVCSNPYEPLHGRYSSPSFRGTNGRNFICEAISLLIETVLHSKHRPES